MGGKSGEMDCFEGARSWLRRDPAPPGGLFNAFLPKNGLRRRCWLRLAARFGDVSPTALSTGAGQLHRPSPLMPSASLTLTK